MPSLKEIKTRIASVKNTRKITSAMKMVSSSKLHHAQIQIENMLPYENMLEHILKSFLASTPENDTIFDKKRSEIKRVALVVFASNSSLCGSFNGNVLKLMMQVIEEYRHLGKDNIVIYPIGRKVFDKVKKLGFTPAGNFNHLADKPNAHECQKVAREITKKFAQGELDQVEIIYHHFKSAGTQILKRKTFLPIGLSTEVGVDNDRDLSSDLATAKAQEYLRKNKKTASKKAAEEAKPLNDDFIVEPDIRTVLSSLIPKQLHLMFYTALLDSDASEHAARMVAMQTATDNADELLSSLNLQLNKSRQQAITNELLDIVGGSINN